MAFGSVSSASAQGTDASDTLAGLGGALFSGTIGFITAGPIGGIAGALNGFVASDLAHYTQRTMASDQTSKTGIAAVKGGAVAVITGVANGAVSPAAVAGGAASSA